MPESAIQFCAPEFIINLDDMGLYSDFTGKGICEGKENDGQQAIVTKASAKNTSYNNHIAKDDTHQFDGTQFRITNGLAAGGGVLPAFVQVLGFSQAEMPPDKGTQRGIETSSTEVHKHDKLTGAGRLH